MDKNKPTISRRQFIQNTALIGTSLTIGTGGLLSSCIGEKSENTNQAIERLQNWRIPVMDDMAVDGQVIKVGVVGCGGQGTGDVISLTKAANGIEIIALGDVFQDKIDNSRKQIKNETGQDVPVEKCFIGFDAYQKVIDSGVDLVLLTTPPAFRPAHFEAVVRAGKHVFMEKPAGVDVTGALKILATSKMADSQQLSVIAGTQYRHQRSYVEAFKQVANGVIGEILGGEVYYNQGMLWHRNREQGWNDMEYMLRDWVNWCWLSGDHIVEQHIHSIDTFSWFCGLKPVNAIGFGARQRRITGDQYDMFSTDFVFENSVHLHSMCRQIDGCTSNISNIIQGTKGVWYNVPASRSEILDLQGNTIWKWDFEKEKQEYKQTNPYVLQFVDLITAIRTNKPVNETEDAVNSTLIGIMGRESAYTGQTITFEQLKSMDMNLLPQKIEMGNMDMNQYKVPVPGYVK